MSNHLTSEEMTNLLSGETSSADAPHLQSCGECLGEFKRLKDTLSVFHDSMHDWTSRQTSDAQRDFSKPIPRRLGWAIPAAVAAGVLALTPAYLSIREVQREVDRINDALLMQQVDVQLGRTVPVSMEPLMELMKYDETEQIGAEQ